MPLEGNKETHYLLKRAISDVQISSVSDPMLILIVTAQYGQRQWDRVGGFPRRAAEIPPHLQVWCWNKYIWHKVGDARSAVMNFGPLTRYHRTWLSNTHTRHCERSSLALGEHESASSFFFSSLSSPSLSLSLVPRPVGRSVNQLGPTGSCGAWEPPHLPTRLWAQGSVAPFQGWPAGPKWHSTTTEVTWNSLSVTTNQSPPSLPCRWDTSHCLRIDAVHTFRSLLKKYLAPHYHLSLSYSVSVPYKCLWKMFSVVPVQGGYSPGHTHRGGWVEQYRWCHSQIQNCAQLLSQLLGLDRTVQGKYCPVNCI